MYTYVTETSHVYTTTVHVYMFTHHGTRTRFAGQIFKTYYAQPFICASILFGFLIEHTCKTTQEGLLTYYLRYPSAHCTLHVAVKSAEHLKTFRHSAVVFHLSTTTEFKHSSVLSCYRTLKQTWLLCVVSVRTCSDWGEKTCQVHTTMKHLFCSFVRSVILLYH